MTLAIIAGGVAIIAILAYAVWQTGQSGSGLSASREAELNDDPNLPGLYVAPHPGPDGIPGTSDDRRHVNAGVVIPICSEEQLEAENFSDPVCYHSNPPTSGPHSTTPQGFTNLEHPAPKENIVHSMEHGGVYIWYNTDDQEVIDRIHRIVDNNTDRRRFVGSTIYEDMEDDYIAVTAWTRLDKFHISELDEDRIQEFINEHHKRFNPEGF